MPTVVTVPSDNVRLGIFAAGGPTPASCPAGSSLRAPNAQVCVNNYSKALLASYPSANSAVSGDTGNFVFAGAQAVPENFGTIRLDHRISDKDSLFGTYLIDKADYTQPDKMDLILTNSSTKRQTVSIEETDTFGTSLVNASRVRSNRDYAMNQFTPRAVTKPHA